jgi:ketosteroid isomerase-like protein
MRNFRVEGKSDIREIEIVGSVAYLRNFLDMTIAPEGGEPIRKSGHVLTILRKEADRRWRLARDANLLI